MLGKVSMTSYSLAKLANQLGAIRFTDDACFSRLCTDTRMLQAGDLFVALIGPNFDGHDFILQSQSKCAAAALVTTEAECDLPQLVVRDMRYALGQLAKIRRQSLLGKVIAVTGSCGKTTVKEMLAKILAESGRVEVTEGNLNNDIGVPLTLWNMDTNADYHVFELGANHVGEIAFTNSMVQPHIAILTNASLAHLSGFGSLQGVVKAKGEIVSGLRSDGTVVLNWDDPHFGVWQALAGSRSVISFSLTDTAADIHARNMSLGAYGSQFEICYGLDKVTVELNLIGRHNVANSLAATGAALASGLSLQQVADGLCRCVPFNSRLQYHPLSDGCRVIDDTYNANPASVMAAIQVLQLQPGGRCMILGDLAELGSDAQLLHRKIGQQVAEAGIEYFFTVGSLAVQAGDSFIKHGGKQGMALQSNVEIVPVLKQFRQPNITYLVKGSRSAGMERIVKSLLVHED